MTTRRIHIRAPERFETSLSPAEQRIALRDRVQARGERFVPMTRLRPADIARARPRIAPGGRHAV